jgi:hypothetical protein
MRPYLICGCLILVLIPAVGAGWGQKDQASAYRPELEEAARLVSLTPQSGVKYDYVMTAAVRLLLFWVSRDDVGQGTIRIGTEPGNSSTEIVQLLMGSDPAKAPLGINRWGAAVEVWRRADGTGAFFGFMKASKGDSIAAARDDLSREKESRRYQFEGIISRMSNGSLVSITVPINTDTDFTLHQLPLAQQMVMEKLKTASGPARTLDGRTAEGCAGGSGFLFTLHELMTAVLSGQKAPITRCFLYVARRYTMTINSNEAVKELKVSLRLRGATVKSETTYHSLRKADFRVVNTQTGFPTDFQLTFGESGELRAIPIQIEFQPNWWFRVIVSLKPNGIKSGSPQQAPQNPF